MTEKIPNHLAGQNSPYLLQHAFNPVDWYPWGEPTWRLAREKNCLVVISIGYAACHWCHVMEQESFEDIEVARVMNTNYISVKVDREERPDVDQIYMAAAYATTGRGGWPLNVIALPDQRPVFAGTYFSRHDWIYLLNYYSRTYKNHPGDLDYQASQVLAGVKQHFVLPGTDRREMADNRFVDELFAKMKEDFDLVNGGTFGAPKFPMPVYLEFILSQSVLMRNQEALDFFSLTLDRMHMGGIYDHLDGGFCRYSVDAMWHVPHFEKMLYDNAQLISIYSKGFCVSGKQHWKRAIIETIEFVNHELTNDEGLCYSSLDADSEGREGAYYIWTSKEVMQLLGDDAGLLLEFFSCEQDGNWEDGFNILRLKNLSAEEYPKSILNSLKVLKTERRKRLRPATDTKILTAWNALMISAYVDAYRSLAISEYLDKAISLANLYLDYYKNTNGHLMRDIRSSGHVIPAYLDDYSFLVKALVDLHQATLDTKWIYAAKELTDKIFQLFQRTDSALFNLTPPGVSQLFVKAVETADNVIASSNSAMAHNLFRLGYILHDQSLVEHAKGMLGVMLPRILSNPAFHAQWATVVLELMTDFVEVKIQGSGPEKILSGFLGNYLPGVVFSDHTEEGGKPRDIPAKVNQDKRIWICRSKSCFPPVETPEEALALIRKKN